MNWETIEDTTASVTERAAYGDGHLLRMTWRHRREIGVDALDGSAMLFVPGPMPNLTEHVPETVAVEAAEPVEDASAAQEQEAI